MNLRLPKPFRPAQKRRSVSILTTALLLFRLILPSSASAEPGLPGGIGRFDLSGAAVAGTGRYSLSLGVAWSPAMELSESLRFIPSLGFSHAKGNEFLLLADLRLRLAYLFSDRLQIDIYPGVISLLGGKQGFFSNLAGAARIQIGIGAEYSIPALPLGADRIATSASAVVSESFSFGMSYFFRTGLGWSL